MSKNKKIIFIVGTTASGKSKLSYQLATKYNAAIVNCDSLQVYKSLNIGSAKPSQNEMETGPHYLFGHIDDGIEYTAGKFRKEALEVIESTPHDLYLFVGGSGFYIQALVNGMFEETPVKESVKEEVQQKKVKLGDEGLYSLLKEKDPVYADKIHPNDRYRVSRALELVLSLNKSMEQIGKEFSEKKTKLEYPFLYFGSQVNRESLHGKIANRLDTMMEMGFEKEVRELLARDLKAWKPMQSVGYKEMMSFIEGRYDLATFKEEVVKNTMRLAKRQMTWFKRNKDIHWLDLESKIDLDQLDKILNDFLSV